MTEYVYALHDFLPENEDEVPFRAGERIEVIERDDQFGDGWYQVSPVPRLLPTTLPHGMCWAPSGRGRPRAGTYISRPAPALFLFPNFEWVSYAVSLSRAATSPAESASSP
jgi:hypothetical protein